MKNWQGKLLPQRGDVIRSPKFSFGYYSPDGKTICVDGKSKTHPVVRKIVMEEKEDVIVVKIVSCFKIGILALLPRTLIFIE